MKQINIENQSNKKNIYEVILLCLYYVLASAYIPLCSFLHLGEIALSAISLAVCVLGILALSRIAGGFKTILGYVLILGIFIFLGGSLIPVGIISAFITAVCVLAHLLLKSYSPFLWGLPVIPFIISVVTVGSAASAAVSLAAFPAALGLAWSVKDKVGRVSAVCRISAGICVIAVAAFLCAVHSAYGEISFSTCKQLIESFRSTVSSILITAANEMQSSLGYDSQLINLEQTVSYAVSVAFNVLPALVIILSNVVAYVIHSLFLSAHFNTAEERKDARPMIAFEMSTVSAVVFLVSLVLSAVLSAGKWALYGAVAENLMIILIPGLVLTALAGLRVLTMRKGPSCLGTLIYLGAIFMIASLSPLVLIAASIAGAVLVILTQVAKSKAQKK